MQTAKQTTGNSSTSLGGAKLVNGGYTLSFDNTLPSSNPGSRSSNIASNLLRFFISEASAGEEEGSVGNGGLRGKITRFFKNSSEENQIIDKLFFTEDSPLTVESLLRRGNYKFGIDQTGDAYAKYSVSSGIYSVSGNIDKNGRLFGVSVSVGTSFQLSSVELGLKVDIGKIAPFVGRQFNDFIVTNSGLSGQVYRTLKNRQTVIDTAIDGVSR